MTKKRFTNIEHDYENAWIKCNDDGDFMIYAIYKELDESLPSLEDLLNGLAEENEQLKKENKELKSILQDMGLLMSNEEVKNVRDKISSKLIKPLCKRNGFDVDVNTENGFTIIPKGDLND